MLIAQKDVDGNFWLEHASQDNLCPQCNRPIEDGSAIFMDAEGRFYRSKGVISIRNICIYHLECIIDLKPEDREIDSRHNF